ncbi:Molecular chaperone IbpA, HSP20 family [Nannocystis exedens]|uniref:Molecular chaperone IbpA, HSP20 family n=1 Tax=Nannocystis exedens TaxID=54 RepID=A0A1I1VTB1_9BACT|nr:Hsp20/alpha crystallin family protein [Nannocystis exedens]PCC72832.1 heat-shock protein [Nannocystis exedens]SFD86277.1 Molecular chaperone IbpA, HSP20 family [Nannocystis exedens]
MSQETTTQVTQSKPNTPAAESTRGRPVVAPPVDIYENQEEYLVLADLPGVKTDDVQIRFEDGELTIRASRADIDHGEVLGAEFTAADYVRRFSIPETVDASKIDAKLQAGVLELTLPKASRVKPRQIAVKSA